MDSAELSHTENRIRVLEEASCFSPALRGNTSLRAGLASDCFAVGLRGKSCLGKLVGLGCACRGKQGGCDLHASAWAQWAAVLVSRTDGRVAASLPLLLSLPALSRDLISVPWGRSEGL